MQKLSDGNIEFVKGNANFLLIKCYDKCKKIVDKLKKKKILISGGFLQDFLKDYIKSNCQQ